MNELKNSFLRELSSLKESENHIEFKVAKAIGILIFAPKLMS